MMHDMSKYHMLKTYVMTYDCNFITLSIYNKIMITKMAQK